MPFVSDWAAPHGRVLVNFAEPVLRVFERHIQHKVSDCEAGGLLLGTVHGSNILLTEATVPTAWDRQLRYLFERMPFGHRGIAKRRWRASAGTVRYLGEWHTHPQDYPLPSRLDQSEWMELARKRLDGRPMLAVIVGRSTLHVELVSNVGPSMTLTSMR
jgi:integrative and conjugative element protein (TIGR02256 family)